jgi:hypothetical protein
MRKALIILIILLGVVSVKSQNYDNIVSYHINGTPAHGAKIKTNIPFVNGVTMPMVKIEGYAYNNPANINLTLSWYIYNNAFLKTTVSSYGGITPDVWLSNEDGKVVVYLEMKVYFQRFMISAFAKGLHEKPEYFEGWTVVDEPLSGTDQIKVPYRNIMNSLTVNSISVGTDIDNTGIGSMLYLRGTANNSDHVWLAKYVRGNDQTDLRVNIGDYKNGDRFVVGTQQPDNVWEEFFVASSLDKGRVGIGVSYPTCALDVNGTIRSKEVKIEATGWADFVFDKNYKLPTLESVEQHIAEKQHLPDMPSEKEVLEEGINVVEMQAKLLQKIEELTLYVIEQDKKIKRLEEENQEIKSQMK